MYCMTYNVYVLDIITGSPDKIYKTDRNRTESTQLIDAKQQLCVEVSQKI